MSHQMYPFLSIPCPAGTLAVPPQHHGAVQRGDPGQAVRGSCRFPRCIAALQRPAPALGGHGGVWGLLFFL